MPKGKPNKRYTPERVAREAYRDNGVFDDHSYGVRYSCQHDIKSAFGIFFEYFHRNVVDKIRPLGMVTVPNQSIGTKIEPFLREFGRIYFIPRIVL